MQYKGVSRKDEIKAVDRRRDTRWFGRRISDFLASSDSIVVILLSLPLIAFLAAPFVPLVGELAFVMGMLYIRLYVHNKNRLYDFPWRVPKLANAFDGSKPGKKKGAGITYLGYDATTREPIWADNTDMRAHMLVLGTTGSGKTELLLGLCANAIAQNTGFIYIDGKGDPKLLKDVFRIARGVGREDDLFVINFITSGRDFVEKQSDKMTNTLNIMGNTSSGMLIETIVALMDSGGTNTDMWKGRAISFIAALTRPLVFLRDKGYMNLSPEKYLEHFELAVIEDLVWNHNGRYSDLFDMIVAPLRAYLLTLPGYSKEKIKKQDSKTLEQHGYITMQLTRIFNDLTFNYGHIFGVRIGEIDFFDVVLNRRILVALLPALERSTDSMAMLGKLIVGSIKQMMAGCLGNRVEGTVREIIDSRPTNAPTPYYVILDEYGYYTVTGFAVAPAQARSLGFSMIFAAQDFSSMQKSSKEEADATWENTGVRAIGRLSSGRESETYRRVSGAAGEAYQAVMSGFERHTGITREVFSAQGSVQIEKRERLDYDDLASQSDGAFTFMVGKYEQGGQVGGVRVIHGMSFYVGGGPVPKRMRINDLVPIEPPEQADLPRNRATEEALRQSFADGSFTAMLNSVIKPDTVLTSMHNGFEHNHINTEHPRLGRHDAALAVLGWLVSDKAQIPPAASRRDGGGTDATRTVDNLALTPDTRPMAQSPAMLAQAASAPSDNQDLAEGETTTGADGIAPTNLISASETNVFRTKAFSLLRQYRLHMREEGLEDDGIWTDDMPSADRDRLVEMEMSAKGMPFSTPEEKWDVIAKADALRAEIAQSTNYINQPPLAPPKLSDGQPQQRLNALENICGELLNAMQRDS
ncbi:MAG: TraM recognition domain-containing protein [Betaproteobacteria bacterium]|nr:TraM recognition domain-containing protein [Betaproteobacteria bacterium]